jgi:hypothetical protein
MPLSSRSRIGVQARLPRFPILPDLRQRTNCRDRRIGTLSGIFAASPQSGLWHRQAAEDALAGNMVSPFRRERCPTRFVRLRK